MNKNEEPLKTCSDVGVIMNTQCLNIPESLWKTLTHEIKTIRKDPKTGIAFQIITKKPYSEAIIIFSDIIESNEVRTSKYYNSRFLISERNASEAIGWLYRNKFIENKEIENFNKGKEVVYLLEDRGLYKIGYTADLKSRISRHKTSSPTVVLLKQFNGNRKNESFLHNHFKSKNITREWFKLDSNDLLFIENYFSNNTQKLITV